MRAVNLFLLANLNENSPIERYERVLSNRRENVKRRIYEIDAIAALSQKLLENEDDIECVNGFFYSYTIPQIGKEFDLIKIGESGTILNIEIKSESVTEDKIKKQLLRNRYYLEPIADKLHLFTYVHETGKLYHLDGNVLEDGDYDELKAINKSIPDYCISGIENMFRPSEFLIEPMKDPQTFVENKYFLTLSQESMKKNIYESVRDGKKLIGITGAAGTGKTLLLYDLAREVSENEPVCVIHGGTARAGHRYMNEHMPHFHVIEAKHATGEKLTDYKYIFVDETQHLSRRALNAVLEANKNGVICIFAYDSYQLLKDERDRRNSSDILKEIEGFKEYKLSERIRYNKDMLSFIRSLLDVNNKPSQLVDYSDIDILYADNAAAAKRIIMHFEKNEGYKFINYPQSMDDPGELDAFGDIKNEIHLAGVEYDRVILYMDNSFRYGSKGILQSNDGPHPEYISYRYLYQALTRARQKLCIVVVGNPDLFEKLLGIKDSVGFIKDPLIYRR